MVFLEEHARLLLLAHGVAAVFLVGAATHQAWWCRGYLRGDFRRAPAERRIAAVAAAAYALTFLLGNLAYPAYRVRVRAEFLDAPAAVAADAAARREAAARLDHPLPPSAPAPLDGLGRLFDIKEHWAALGCAAALALAALARWAHPSTEPRVAPLYLGLSLVVCGCAWAGAVIGALVASYRTV